jgi:hypothetical protein
MLNESVAARMTQREGTVPTPRAVEARRHVQLKYACRKRTICL